MSTFEVLLYTWLCLFTLHVFKNKVSRLMGLQNLKVFEFPFKLYLIRISLFIDIFICFKDLIYILKCFTLKKIVFFRAAPKAYGSSQVRGQIRDAAAGL